MLLKYFLKQRLHENISIFFLLYEFFRLYEFFQLCVVIEINVFVRFFVIFFYESFRLFVVLFDEFFFRYCIYCSRINSKFSSSKFDEIM